MQELEYQFIKEGIQSKNVKIKQKYCNSYRKKIEKYVNEYDLINPIQFKN